MSSNTEIDDLTGQGESQVLEFKQSIPKDLAKSICGMANASGGTIVLGVADDGSVVGVNTDNRTVANFDSKICREFGFPEDMNRHAYETWRSSLPAASAKMPPEELLPKLSASEEHRGGLLLRNAAVLMFAEEPSRFVPHCQITYLLFNGSSGTRIVKREDFAMPASLLLDAVMELFERHMNTAYVMTGKPRRENITEYPLNAVREALVNAVVHRDWNLHGANVFFELHSDRLCVKSPGGFPLGVNEENIARVCVRRNELLADLMQRSDLMEKAGTGITRMREECEAHGTPPPEIVDIGHHVAVTFRPHPKASRFYTDR